MNPLTPILIAMFVGFILESLLLCYKYFDLKKMLLCFVTAFTLFFLLPTNELTPLPWDNLPFALLGYVIGFAIIFRRELLPYVNEYTVFMQTLLFWLGLYYFVSDPGLQILLYSVGMVASALVLFSVFRSKPLSHQEHIGLYAWFLFAGLAVVLFQIPTWFISMKLEFFTLSESVIAGMLIFYITLQTVYVLMFIPPPKDRPNQRTEWKKHIQIASQRFLPHQSQKTHILFILLAFSALVSLNTWLKVIPHHIFFNLLIIGSIPLLSRFPKDNKQV